jgi:hypothetical protein
MADLEETVKDVTKAVKARGEVNIAGRKNVAVARNVGGHGSRQGVSTRQSVRIRQNDGESREEVITESGTVTPISDRTERQRDTADEAD